MSRLVMMKTVVLVMLMILILASFTSIILNRTGSEQEFMLPANAEFSPPHPGSMSGNLDIAIDMRFFNGKGGGSITVTLDGSAASELRRRIDSIYYLTIISPNRNNSKVDGGLNIPDSEVSKFVELVEDRLEMSPVNNQYDLLNGFRSDYDGIFAGVDISRLGGSKGVDITAAEGLSGTAASSTQDITLNIDFGGSFPDTPKSPKFSNGEIIFYSLFGYMPGAAAQINETVPDIRCRVTIDATVVGLGSFTDKSFDSGDYNKYRIPGGEIVSSTQTYDLGSDEKTGYILYEHFNIIQNSITLSIFGLIVGIIILSIPRSYFKKSGRKRKKQWVHLMGIGFFLAIVLLYFLGIDGLTIFIGAPIFAIVVGIAAAKVYTPVEMSDAELLKRAGSAKGDTERSNRYHNEGIASFQKGDLDSALDHFERALEENIHDEVIWNDKGHVLRKLGRYDEALKCFNLALKINPDYDIAARNKRKTLLDLRRQG